MAESIREKVLGNAQSRIVNENKINVECAVCLQTSIHPAELPCGHIFCYLCIKGIVNQGRRCAMCRQDIPVDYLDRPKLLKPVDVDSASQGFDDGHLWFYEGHNGWWQYDERTSLELETAYQKGERCCELLIAGFLYIADFDAMLQYRRNDPCKRRRIKRDLATTSKKGVAGLKAAKKVNSAFSSASDRVSNELIQSLPISGQSILDNINGIRMLSLSDVSSSNSSQTHLASTDENQRPRNYNSQQATSQISCNTTVGNSSNFNIQSTSDDTFYSRNFELDNMIYDTLDWTIEQIESLNLELLNDYEVLFRDVNSYGQLHNSLNRNRSDRGLGNSSHQGSNARGRLNRSLEDQLNSTHRPSVFRFSNEPERRDLLPVDSLLLASQRTTGNVRGDVEAAIVDHSSQINLSSEFPPQPPPRTRMSRARSRRMSPRRSTSLSHETLF